MSNLCLRTQRAIAIVLSLAAALPFSLPGQQIVFDPPAWSGLVSKDQIGSTDRRLRIAAVGPAEVGAVYATVGGVLFQATAQPSLNLRDQPIHLSYVREGDNNAMLQVAFGADTTVTASSPAWLWVKAAQFSRSRYSAAATLFSAPVTADELGFDRSRSPRYWVGYHPDLDDTLIGFLLFAADGMFVDDNPDYLRRITTAIPQLAEYFGYDVQFNEERSAAASRKFRSFLRPIPWETYMLNDLASQYIVDTEGGQLVIMGGPGYHYGTMSGTRFSEITRATEFFDQNQEGLLDVNPLVYTAVYDFARLVAFFNYAKQQDEDTFIEFVESLIALEAVIPTIKTPAAWTPR